VLFRSVFARENIKLKLQKRVAERRGHMVSWSLLLLLIVALSHLATDTAGERVLVLPDSPQPRNQHTPQQQLIFAVSPLL